MPADGRLRARFTGGAGALSLSSAYGFLAEESGSGAVVELPLAGTAGYRTPLRARYAYASAGHLRRVVAIHGNFRPPAVDRLEQAAAALPNRRARRRLTRAGVTRLVVHRELMRPGLAARLIADLDAAGYRTLHEGEDALVYALAP